MRIQKFNESSKTTKAERRDEKRAKIAEIKAKINDFKKEFDVIEIVSFDWKEISEEVIKMLEKTIKSLGGYLQEDPTYEDSDSYGFIISKKPISKEKLGEYADFIEELYDIE
jgi:uncharacterized protein YaaR (DUF327 family)